MFDLTNVFGSPPQSLPLGLAVGAIVAFILSVRLIPEFILRAEQWSLIDAPDGHRKLQKRAVPLGGGVAIQLAVFGAVGLVWLIHPEVYQALNTHWRFTLGLCAAVVAVGLIGLADDILEIRGRQKLIGQILSIGLVVYGGLVIRQVTVLGWELDLGILAVPFTIAWMVGAINALNLIDGLDGLAGSVSVIVALTLGIIAAASGRIQEAIVAWALAGAVAGFLVYNWAPARIFLGDAGSMTIGLILGVLAIRVSMKGAATAALAVPVVLWSVMFFDVAMAILRRRLTGQSVYTTDRSHFHHVLQRHGYSVPAAVCIIGGACLLCCLGVLASIWLQQEWICIATATLVLGGIVTSGLFGQTEMALFLRRGWSFSSSLCRLPGRPVASPQPMESPFSGERDWEPLWQELVDYAERFDLCGVQLNVSVPTLGEEYHAQWNRKSCPSPRELWKSEIPLNVRGLTVGRLTVSGERSAGSGVACVIDVVEGLKPFQIQMEQLLEDCILPPRPTESIVPVMPTQDTDSQSSLSEQSIVEGGSSPVTGLEGSGAG